MIKENLIILIDDAERHTRNYGFGRVARSIIKGLANKKNIELIILCHRNPKVVSDENNKSGVFGKINVRYINLDEVKIINFDLAICVGPPKSARKIITPTLIYTMVDVSDIPTDALESLKVCDGFLVPASKNEKIFKKYFTHTYKVPLYTDKNIFKPRYRYRKEGKQSFGFIYVGTYTYRKGTDLLINAFLNEFIPSEAHLTLLCTESNPDIISSNVISLMLSKDKVSDINIITKPMSDPWLARYYSRHDSFVSLTRGEGWGYPFMEASLCALPVICPNNLPSDDFLNIERNYVINSTPQPIKNIDNNLAVNFKKSYSDPNLSIVEVEIANAQKYLRLAYNNREKLYSQGSKSAQEINKCYNEEVFSNQLFASCIDFIKKYNNLGNSHVEN